MGGGRVEFLLFFGAMVFVVVAPALLTVGLLVAAFSALRDRREAWRAALRVVAARHGLHLATPTATAASGVLDGFEVTVDLYEASTGKAVAIYTRIRVTGGQPPDLTVSARGWASDLDVVLHGQDVGVGDPAFDRAVSVRGDPAEVSSLAGPEARAALREAVAAGATLRGGQWCQQVSGLITNVDAIGRWVAVVVRAARACRDHPRPREGLKARVDHDPEPGVRRTALERGLGVWTGAELIAWSEDPDPVVAVVAAGALGEKGRPRLLASLDAPGEVGRRAAVALSRLPVGAERGRLEARLLGGLDGGWSEGIDALARVGSAAAVPPLHALADAGPVFGEMPRRAREAIRAIQARIEGEEGSLALAPAAGGGLSEAEVERPVAHRGERRQVDGA